MVWYGKVEGIIIKPPGLPPYCSPSLTDQETVRGTRGFCVPSFTTGAYSSGGGGVAVSCHGKGRDLHSLKLTAKAPENRPNLPPKGNFIFQASIFRCYVSFRKGIYFLFLT